MEHRRPRLAIFFAIAITFVQLAAACGGDSASEPSGARPNPDGTLTVVHRNYAFEPKRLTFNIGETIEFRLESKDGIHTFTIDELDINWAVPSGPDPESQTFTFDRAGDFKLICVIPGHEGLGMVGTIQVR
jgi:plastocyanin